MRTSRVPRPSPGGWKFGPGIDQRLLIRSEILSNDTRLSIVAVEPNGQTMTEVEKLSKNQTEPNSEDASRPGVPGIDVPKAVRQRLECLRLAGMTHLPSGTGEYAFDRTPFAILSASKETECQSTSPVGKAMPPVESVRESASSATEFQANSGTKPHDATKSSPQSNFVSSDPWGPSGTRKDRTGGLQVLKEEIAACLKCDELSSKRTQTVFGIGNPEARLVFVGEAPGAQEDRVGEPFVGEAGQLLDKILISCKLTRAEVFILNSVKCRPPGNRNPGQAEIANCWGYAERQLEILQPEFICCLGSVAARTLLKTTQSLGRLRQRFHTYRGSRVLVTYHPAYLLRTPSAKRHVWDDMKMLMKEMGVELSN